MGHRRLNYYLYTDDRDFLGLALEASINTLAQREGEEFDPSFGLFRGPAVYEDGVAAYPDRYATQTGGSSAILDWTSHNHEQTAKAGHGLPMFTLSTNCVYVHAYELLAKMAVALGRPPDPVWH